MLFDVNWGILPYFGCRMTRVEMQVVLIVSAVLQEDLADEQLPRWNLDKSPFNSQILIAAVVGLLLSFSCCSYVCVTVFCSQERVYSGNFSAGHTIDKRDAMWKTSLLVFLN